MHRIALGVEYDGTHYAGWQRQYDQRSIQACLETAIAKVADHPVSIFCAGRTDAGVHATGQVLHFDTPTVRPLMAWVRGTNAYLPADIRIMWSCEVPSVFDARRSALSRRYCYVILNRPTCPAIMRHAVTWIVPPLEISAMQTGANYLLGKHDFSAFRAAQCQARTAIRTLHVMDIKRHGENIMIDVSANAFLYHMVRNMVGALVRVGLNKHPPEWIKMLLETKERRLTPYRAAPQGLYLAEVSYQSHFGLPSPPSLPWGFRV